MSGKDLKPITFGSLFAGIGGFDLGFHRAGMACRWQVEINDYANAVLSKYWPDVARFRDVRSFPPRPDSPWLGGSWRRQFEVDCVAGGFPCQDISYAGLGAGLGGARSGLFFETIRVVRELRPKRVVLENVAALLTRGLDRVLGELAEIGYDVEWDCIPAAFVGANHHRDRVFIVAYADGSGLQRMWAKWQDKKREVASRYIGQGGLGEGDSAKHWESEPAICRVGNGISARVDRLRGLGNAVVPQVAELIGRIIVESIHCENGG